MARADHWSDTEIALTVADYMKMFTLELAGQRYNKSAHRRALLKLLNGRSDAAVELKHQNISAVLRDLNCFWIPGYKPRSNYQEALATYVEDWINSHSDFDRVSQAAVKQPAFVPTGVEFSTLLVETPKPSTTIQEEHPPYSPNRAASKRDYVAQEARNSALGSAGELLILEYEEYRLRSAGERTLANRIEHVAQSKGDGLGYDILSFETSGQERFIEVKTTAFAKETPFYASRNEVSFSADFQDQFHIYRLFEFRKSPKLFSLAGAISDHCQMDPVNFICRLR
ncbi:DUF3883 domain-containing protein [Marinobacter halophilus]|uniref:Protein NO VEIN C-terminal domain-containing protein n=1 Tax=Marinobacter halophilus TaxID=1323740 RepID=A0A2T1K962_9GAMM|nr:DUF3883 domain-containing protein [Marinobacter halophilus]PSF06691.1 hypothetical protein C7H08_16540 [Marinobacter halophilus]GGC74744.1 hypothetical protein GCM10011362_24140 [Marinobacter halophilus]